MDASIKGRIRTVVVDDYLLFRQGVVAMLQRSGAVDIVGQADNGFVALEICRATKPDVVLIDLNMPIMGGMEATRRIKEELPDTKVLILTGTDTDQQLFGAIQAGASGYLLKNISPHVVIDSLKHVAEGGVIIPANLAMLLLTEFSQPGTKWTQNLTDWEAEILRQLSVGTESTQISANLDCPDSSVRQAERQIVTKLHHAKRSCTTSRDVAL